MKNKYLNLYLFLGVIFLLFYCFFEVSDKEYAIKWSKNSPNQTQLLSTGLHFKLPFFESIDIFDKLPQITNINGTNDFPYLVAETFDKHSLEIGYSVVWKINNPKLFFENKTKKNITFLIKDETLSLLTQEMASLTLPQILQTPQQKILIQKILARANSSESNTIKSGIEIGSIYITSINIGSPERSSWIQNMQAEQARQLNELEKQTAVLSQSLRKTSDEKIALTLEKGMEQANHIRTEADLSATAIYAKAYNEDPNFYKFFENLKAYKKVLNSKNDIMILSTHTPFFESLSNSNEK